MAAGRHLGFENSAIRFGVPENRTLEPNMRGIRWRVAELWPFEIFAKCVNWPWGRSSVGRWSVGRQLFILLTLISYTPLLFRYVSNVAHEEVKTRSMLSQGEPRDAAVNCTTVSCGFSATARLSCIHQRPFKCWNNTQYAGCTPVSEIIRDRRLKQFGHYSQNQPWDGSLTSPPSCNQRSTYSWLEETHRKTTTNMVTLNRWNWSTVSQRRPSHGVTSSTGSHWLE